MKCKHCIQTCEVYKWKAHLNIDGSRQVKGQDYWDTYAPVATWVSICLILAKAIIQGWHSKQIDFVMAYTQAPVERDMYIEVPKGFKVEGDSDYVLQIHKIIEDMKQAGLDLTVKGDISNFLGVNISQHEDGIVHLTQPISLMAFWKNFASRETTPRPSQHLQLPASFWAAMKMHLHMMTTSTTGDSLGSSTVWKRALNPTFPMPHISVPASLLIQKNHMQIQSSGLEGT